MLNENFKTTAKENKTEIDILWANHDITTQLNIKEEQIESVEIDDLIIAWNFYVEMRSWGVKTISAFAYNVFTYLQAGDDEAKDIVTLNVEYYKTNDEDAELIECEVEIDVSEFEVVSNVDEHVENRNMYFPTNVEIDFRSKEITVTF